MDCSPPNSSIHGIFQARVLQWVGLPFPSPGDLPDPGVEPVPTCRVVVVTIIVTMTGDHFIAEETEVLLLGLSAAK